MLAHGFASLDDRRAELVLSVAQDQVQVRAGNAAQSPLSTGELRHTARLGAARHEGARFRELDVAGLVVCGWSNEQVSQALGIAVLTVRSHVESAMGKLGCSDRTGMARRAVENDLDSIDALRVASARDF